MRTIPLARGVRAIVDNEMYPVVSKLKWHAVKSSSGKTWYAESTKWNHKFGVKRIKLHHVIVGTPINGLVPDHIDRNGLNNQRSNLRLATLSQNARNRDIYLRYKTHCQRNHPWIAENIYRWRNKRYCWPCQKLARAERTKRERLQGSRKAGGFAKIIT